LRAARELGVASVLERPNTHTAYAYAVVQREYERLGLAMPEGYLHASNPRRLEKEQAEYELADQLACPSRFVAQTFLNRGFSPQQIGVHQYGCDPARFRPRTKTADPPFRAAFVASGDPRKGLHLLLDAWERAGLIGQAELTICGRFQPAYRQLLADKLAQPGIRELGFVDDAAVAACMQESDVLVLPSVEEGSALVTYEARACGCVLVVSDATGAVCTHDREGLIHPAGDVAMLAKHLRMLADDRATLSRLRETSLAGLKELTWQRAAERLAQVYDRARARRRQPALDSSTELEDAVAIGA
jgi:glycosyltransferase involved in cell wall biosynthesis